MGELAPTSLYLSYNLASKPVQLLPFGLPRSGQGILSLQLGIEDGSQILMIALESTVGG
jgi:hypothetical protein